MVTYRNCRAGLRVRVPAPHPGFLRSVAVSVVLLAVLAVTGAEPAQAAELSDGGGLVYAVENDATLFEVISEDLGIEPRVIYTYSPFGFTFTYDDDTGLITSSRVNSLRRYWSQLDTGDKAVATALLDMMLSVEDEVDALSDQVKSTNNVYGGSQISSGVTGITTDTPNLLGLVTQNQSMTYNHLQAALVNRVQGAFYADSGDERLNWGIGEVLALSTYNQRLQYMQQDVLFRNSFPWNDILGGQQTNGTAADILATITWNQTHQDSHMKSWLTTQSGWADMLYWDGSEQPTSADLSLTQLTKNGFMGLGRLIAGSGERVIVMKGVDPSDPLAEGGEYRWPSLFDYFGYMGEEVQRSLVKLQYVLANDSDIQLKQDEKENQDAVEDNFFGDGEAAVKPSDITDAAGIAGDVKDSFSGAGSPGDAFIAINDDTNYSFFSQEVANSLDAVGQPAVVSDDDFMSAFQEDENGFYSLSDPSFWSLEDYLRGFID